MPPPALSVFHRDSGSLVKTISGGRKCRGVSLPSQRNEAAHSLPYPDKGFFTKPSSTTVVLMEKAIAFCNDKTETWLDVAFANKTKPKYESTEQLVAKGLFPGAVALPEPSR